MNVTVDKCGRLFLSMRFGELGLGEARNEAKSTREQLPMSLEPVSKLQRDVSYVAIRLNLEAIWPLAGIHHFT